MNDSALPITSLRKTVKGYSLLRGVCVSTSKTGVAEEPLVLAWGHRDPGPVAGLKSTADCGD